MKTHHAEILSLPVTDLTVLATALARSMTTDFEEQKDLVQEGLYACTRAETYNRKKKTLPEKPWAFARITMQRAMYTYISGKPSMSGARRATVPTTPLDQVYDDLGLEPTTPEDYEMEHYLSLIEKRFGPLTSLVADNLISPRDKSYCEQLVLDAKRKTEAHRRGVRVRGFKHVRGSKPKLQFSLGLSQPRWRKIMHNLRTFTRDVTQHH